MGHIRCCVCNRVVGECDTQQDVIAGLCDVHRVEQRRADDAEDRASEAAETHESTTTGTVVNSGCFGCLLPLMGLGLLAVLGAVLVAVL